MQRTIVPCLSLFVWAGWLCLAYCQQVGDRVVVISQSVDIKSGRDTVDSVSLATVLEVQKTHNEWLLVNSRKPGWLDNRHVVPLDKGLERFTDAIRRNPRDSSAYAARGMLAVEMGDYDRAVADFSEMIRLAPQNPDAYKNRALPLVYKGQHDRAIADYSQAIRLNPRDTAAFYSRGNAHQYKGDYDAAIADFDATLRLDPGYAGAYYSRGIAWHLRGDHDRAIADFDQSIQLDPKYSGAYYHRGIAREFKADYDRAIADFNEAIRLEQKFAGAYFSRGTAWQFKGQYRQAIADFDETIRLEPEFAGAYYNRAWLWATCPDPQVRDGRKAVESATRACELTGWKDAAQLDALAAAHAEAGDFAAAVKRQTEAAELASENEQADFRARLELYRAGKPYHEPPKRPG